MNQILEIAIVIWLYMTIVFLLAWLKEDNSIVDIFWGLGFILVAGYSTIASGNLSTHAILMNLLVVLWAGRLSSFILIRNWGMPEDFRYKAWRDSWKFFRVRSYLQIFMLQGFFMLVIAYPVYLSNSQLRNDLQATDVLGILLFATGFCFEVVGDLQLKRFKALPENKGKIITTGLWKYTRHPNYFGESLLWWGIGFLALSVPGGWVALASPLVITLLLRFVSGVPMLETKYEGRPDWEAYKRKTAPFVPFLKFL
jgi:steroid 5-alpha reductase family enzyme